MTGNAQGAAGVTEAIYSLIMMNRGFVPPSLNIDDPDDEAEGVPIVTGKAIEKEMNCVVSNSFGFGGTNATLAFKRLDT